MSKTVQDGAIVTAEHK